MTNFQGHILYVLALIAAAMALPPVVWESDSHEFMFIIGFLAVWRYSWGLLNWIRFNIYHKTVFPRWRAQANALGEGAYPSHLYLLVTSFRIGTETTRRVYASVMREAITYGRPATIICSIVERADEILIKKLFENLNPPAHLKLVIVRIGGTGKRDALAYGFRAIARECPPEGAIAAVIDGDSMLPENSLRECVSLFALQPDLGALTTDEICEVEGNWIFRKWYNMRFAQRHIFMGSVSLSRRVLTLTGRMSMFRAELLIRPEFIERVELDWIDHWRLGRFKFLTGDDKSSWFHLLAEGHAMIYIPDVKIVTIETPPDPSFFKSSITLMRRWFGNMLRTNARAIALGPKPMGWFTWISIVDQRLSMWTSLTGLVAAILVSIALLPMAMVYYLWWIAFTRYILTLSLLAGRPSVDAFYPFLLYYNQIVGSFMKTMVLFRLDKQKWTRQNTVLARRDFSLSERFAGLSSAYMHTLAMAIFVTLLATLTHVIDAPNPWFWHHIIWG